MRIGSRVFTSPLVQLLAVNHLFDDPTRPFVEQGITARGITVEDDVWIGAGAIVTDGVTIGRGAVVAAGAVVTRDVPPRTVAAGSPARVVREVGDPAGRPSSDTPVYFWIGPRPGGLALLIPTWSRNQWLRTCLATVSRSRS